MCFFIWSCSIQDISQTLHSDGWILMWTLLHGILKVREEAIIICDVNICTSQTFEIIILLMLLRMHSGYVSLQIILFSTFYDANSCTYFMCFWECILVMCIFKLSSSLHSMRVTLALLTHESYTIEITTILCSSDSALWLCVSSNYLHQYMNFSNPSFEWFHPNMNSFYMLFQKLEKEYHHHLWS